MLDILFEDDDLVAINKPSGLLIHPNPVSPGRERRSEPDLETLVREHLRTRANRVVLFHRLDKETSGVVLFGKQPKTFRAMTEAFEKKRIRKTYHAVVDGIWDAAWSRVETALRRAPDGRRMENCDLVDGALPEGAKQALTTFRLLKSGHERSWIEAIPKTGRTHQIRLHCLRKGCPILGDRLYEKHPSHPDDPALALHAHRLDFRHPVTGVEVRITAPLPERFRSHWLVGLSGGDACEF